MTEIFVGDYSKRLMGSERPFIASPTELSRHLTRVVSQITTLDHLVEQIEGMDLAHRLSGGGLVDVNRHLRTALKEPVLAMPLYLHPTNVQTLVAMAEEVVHEVAYRVDDEPVERSLIKIYTGALRDSVRKEGNELSGGQKEVVEQLARSTGRVGSRIMQNPVPASAYRWGER